MSNATEQHSRGGEFVTRYEAEKLMTQMLKDYDTQVGAPRHRETQDSLSEIKGIVEQGKEFFQNARGAAWLAGAFAACASVVWVVLQIRTALK